MESPPTTHRCVHCGKPVSRPPGRRGPVPKTCGRDCWRASKEKACVDCGAAVRSVNGVRCRPCGLKAAPRGIFAVEPGTVRRCAECHAEFVPKTTKSRYCSDRCQDRMHGRHRGHKRRSAQKTGERFSMADLFARDRGLCQLCGGGVDLARRWPDPLSPSVDHVVPLSRGGPHTLANCQLAHLGCNSRKHNRQESLV